MGEQSPTATQSKEKIKMWQSVKFNTEEKMTRCYNLLNDRHCYTLIVTYGDKIIGYYVNYETKGGK